MASFTCKGCKNRHYLCHSECEKYLAEKAAWDAQQAKIRKAKAVEDGLNHHLVNTIERNRKRVGIQKPSRIGGQ